MDELWIMKHTALGRFVQVQELVQCKDCKYWLGSDEMCLLRSSRLLAYEKHEYLKPDGFCSGGERKDES